MKGTYRGLMTIDELFQALFQDKSFFAEHGITHVRSASLYFTPCDDRGNEVIVRDEGGVLVEGYETAGCYRSAAEKYDKPGDLEPKTVRRPTRKGRGKRSWDTRRLKPG
ncbi:MAG: hypothetical protein E5X52_33545 [Mesorhizobium sp.]|nr:MAG: hypothetical protein E5X52_33545 [Mesorhizobium sp.]